MDEDLQHWVEARLRRLVGAGAAAEFVPLRVEASHRRFYRLRWRHDGAVAATFVAMTSPPELENNAQFVALAELFHESGIGVPELLAADTSRGWFLMSDLGQVHFEDVYGSQGPDAVLPGALTTLHKLQQIRDPRVPAYTRQRFEDELDIYTTWFLQGLLEVQPSAGLADAFGLLVASTQSQPTCCVHRDFHCRNLLLTPTGNVGVVDFQDALMGPATYDLASLLRDCYYRFPESEVARWRDAWLARTPLEVARESFARDLDFTALQRQLKAVGIFARLHLRDGRDSHLPNILPVLRRIGELAEVYPETRSLAEHVAAILPRSRTRLEATT